MAKLLLYGDLHIGASRAENDKIINTIDFINKTAHQENVDGIINLGDTLDCSGGRKQILNPTIITLLNKLDLSEHYILRGNHEYHAEGDLLSILKCKKFIDIPSIIFDCLFVPYTKIYDSSLYPNKSFKYVFSHCDIHGGLYDNGHQYTGKSNRILDFVKYEKLYIGHYHIRQEISGNVFSIGATQSRIKSNNNSPLGITILDTLTDKTIFIENPYSYYEVIPVNQKNFTPSEFIDNPDYNVLDDRQSIIDKISTLAKSDELISEFFRIRGLDSEIIKALTKGELPNDFE